MEYYISNSSDELTHWGIKGMRWGIRRYQNKDGSLTPAGKKKLKAETEAIKKEEQTLKNRKSTKAKFDKLAARRKALEDDKKAFDEETNPFNKKNASKNKTANKEAEPAKKSAKDMSDAELTAAINRARMEDEYNRLRPEPVNEKHPLMKKMVNEMVVPAVVNSGKQLLEKSILKMGEKALKGKIDPNSLEALTAVRDKLKVQTEIEEYKNGGKFNWDNMLKKQLHEDTEAKRRGFKDAADENAQKRAAEEAEKKAKADEKAQKRAAEEAEKKAKAAEKAQKRAAKEAEKKAKADEAANRVAPNDPPKKTSSPAVDTFISRIQNKPVSEVSSSRTRTMVQAKLEADDYDFDNWGRYDRSIIGRMDDD